MPATADPDEGALLLKLQRGDAKAFERLYFKYSKTLYWKLQRMVRDSADADEFLQMVFVKVWERRIQVDPRKPFGPYIYSIAANLIADHYRRQARVANAEIHLQASNSELEPTTEDLLISKETHALLNEAISLLPEQRRQAFMLCKVEGRSYKEAAEIMNISPNTVHNHLTKAVQTVKDYLQRSETALSPLLLLAVFRFF